MDTSLVQTIKLMLVNGTGLSKDALHIYVGLSVFFLVSAISRKPVRRFMPLLAVVLVATLGECVDMVDNISSIGYWRWAASMHDILNTVFWPTVIFMLARWTSVFGKKAAI